MAGDRTVPVGTQFHGDLAKARTTLRENSLVAMERQVELLEWLRSTTAEDYFASYLSPRGSEPEWARKSRAKALHGQVSDLVKQAPTYYVSPDMTTIIEHAAEDLGRYAEEGLSPLDLLTERGFLYFDRPVPVEVQPVLYYVYGDPKEHARWCYSEIRQDSVRIHQEVMGEDPPLPVHVIVPPDVNASLDVTATRRLGGPLVLWDHSGWAYGSPWVEGNVNEVQENIGTGHASSITVDAQGRLVLLPQVSNMRKLLLATWKMLSQTIVHVGTERPGRPLRRRAGRVIPDPQDVIVVRLRREYDPAVKYEAEHGEELDEPWYNHRFMVKGHWRRQPYGPGKSQTKIIYVAPFIKGPADAPLILRNRIYSVEQ